MTEYRYGSYELRPYQAEGYESIRNYINVTADTYGKLKKH